MPPASSALLVHCEVALGLSHKELGQLLGRDKRTILRWQDKGFAPTPDQAQTLADALRPVRPDLADKVLELGRQTAIQAGMTPPFSPATPEVIDAVLRAAAEAGGTSPAAVRPAVTAAFLKAEESGVDVRAVLEGLRSGAP